MVASRLVEEAAVPAHFIVLGVPAVHILGVTAEPPVIGRAALVH
jgi:hypothetical protein